MRNITQLTRHVIWIVASLLVMTVSAHAASEKVGVVGAMHGQVNATSEQGEKRSLSIGDAIYINDEIVTNANASAQLMFLDKSALTVSPNSHVIIDRFVFNPASNDGEMALQTAKGALRFIGGALSKKKPVTLKTPVSTIGIRGAIADAHIDANNGATDAIFIYGKELSVTNLDGQTQITTDFGTGLSLASAMAIPRVMPVAEVQQRIVTSPVNAARNIAPATSNSPSVDQKINQIDNKKASDTTTPQANNNNATPSDASNTTTSAARNKNTGNRAISTEANTAPKTATTAAKPGTLPAIVPFKVAAPTADIDQNDVATIGNTTLTNRVRTVIVDSDTDGKQSPNLRLGSLFNNILAVREEGETPAEILPDTNNTNAQQDGPRPTELTRDNNSEEEVVNTPPPPPSSDSGTSGGGVTPPAFTLFGHQNSFSSAVNTEEGIALRSSDDNTQYVGEIIKSGATNIPFELAKFTTSSTSATGSIDGGDTLTGNAYISTSGALNYYDLTDGITGERHTFLFGNRTLEGEHANAAAAATKYNVAAGNTASSSLSINGITYYNFLPQFAGDGTEFGAFDGNQSSLGTSQYDVGLAVNWNKKHYNYTELDWSNGNIHTVFGRLDGEGSITLNGDNRVSGGNLSSASTLFNFDSSSHSSTIQNDVEVNPAAVFSENGGAIEGFAIEANSTLQPVIVDTATNPSTAGIRNLTNTNSLNGFAAGFITPDSGAAPPVAYLNNKAAGAGQKVKILRSADGNSVGAHLVLDDANSANVADKVEATFGSIGGSNNTLLSENYYAAKQNTHTLNGTNDTTNLAGAIVAVPDENSPNVVVCSECQYAHWGAWAATVERSSITGQDHVEVIPYIAGSITTDAELTAHATALGAGAEAVLYTGEALASVAGVSGIEHVDGLFDAEIDLANRELNDINISFTSTDIGNASIGMSGGPATFNANSATFSNVALTGTSNISSVGAISGTANGALFGSNAQELGGNFHVQGTDVEAAGIYLGRDDNL